MTSCLYGVNDFVTTVVSDKQSLTIGEGGFKSCMTSFMADPYLVVVTGLECVVDADGEGDGQHGPEDDVVDDREGQGNHFEVIRYLHTIIRDLSLITIHEEK